MLKIETEIQGLTFIQIDILGCYLPSHTSIEYALSRFNDKRRKQIFRDFSDRAVLHYAQRNDVPIHMFHDTNYDIWDKTIDWSRMSELDLNQIFPIITKFACEITGDSFRKVIQSDFTISWFNHLLYNRQPDVQEIRKVTTNLLRFPRVPHNDTVKDFFKKHPNNKPIYQESNICECAEYIEALNYIYMRDCRLREKAHCNLRAFSLLRIHVEFMKRKAEVAEKSRREIAFLVLCEKGCGAYFMKEQVNRTNTCNSCKKKSKEQKNASRRDDRRGWVFDQIGACDGDCVSLKKRIGESGLCWACYQKKFPK